MFEIPHGEVDSDQARVNSAASGDPDGSVGFERGAEELAFRLWLLTYILLVGDVTWSGCDAS